MSDFESIAAKVQADLAVVDDSSDPTAVDAAYSTAIDTLRAAAADATGPLADRLGASLRGIADRRPAALRDLALARGDFDEADARHAERIKSRRDAIADLEQQIKAGRTADELGDDPKYIEGLIDEDDADYLIARYVQDPVKLQENAGRIEATARRGIQRFEAIGEKSKAADCHLTLVNLYRAIGEIEKAGDAGTRAAALLERAAAENEDDAATLLRALRLRGLWSVQIGILDLTRARFDRFETLFDTAIAAYDRAASTAAGLGDTDGKADVEFQAQMARVLKLIGEFSLDFARGDRNAATAKLAEAKDLLGPLEEMTDQDNVRDARMMITSVEADQAFVGAFAASARADWDAAEIGFAQTFHLFDRLRSIASPEELAGIAAREALYRACGGFFDAQRLVALYRFTDALPRFRGIPELVDRIFGPYRNDLSRFQQELLSNFVPALDMFIALAKAQALYAEATLYAYRGKYEAAIALVESSVGSYREARGIAVRTRNPEQFHTLCANLEETASSLARFLEAVPDQPRLRLALASKQDVEIGESVEVTVRLQNDADVAAGTATCSITVPADCEIRRAAGLAANGGKLSWSGPMAAHETRELLITLKLPEKPGLFYVEAICEAETSRETTSLKIAASAPTVRSNLGFMRVSLSESQANVAKIVGWVFTLVAGGVIGVLFTKVMH